jgi:hypothetical protein
MASVRKLGILTAVLAFLVFVPATAHASSITFKLNCNISSAGCGAPTGDFGSVTLTDIGNSIQVAINLTNAAEKVLALYLNFSSSLGTSGWSLSGNGIDPPPPPNPNFHQKPDGYKGYFGMEIGFLSNFNGPWLFTISKANTDLSLSDFMHFDECAVGDPCGFLNAAVHAGGVNPSKWYGGTSVPEPATMLLFAVGGGFLARRLRRRA